MLGVKAAATFIVGPAWYSCHSKYNLLANISVCRSLRQIDVRVQKQAWWFLWFMVDVLCVTRRQTVIFYVITVVLFTDI